MTQNNSLRTLSEETGGFAICQTNDYTKGLQRIDAETSDYYIIGYTSSIPIPFKVRRAIKIEVTRPGVKDVIYREFYTIPKTERPDKPEDVAGVPRSSQVDPADRTERGPRLGHAARRLRSGTPGPSRSPRSPGPAGRQRSRCSPGP